MRKDNIINDLYSKCNNLIYEIQNKITEILSGSTMQSALDKVKEKIGEKIENLYESIKLLDREISELADSAQSSLIWKK